MAEKKLLIGAHMSAAGGVHNAPYEGKKIRANIIQLFTSNQRQWNSTKLTQNEITLWEESIKATQMTHIMSHDSYLINLGSPQKELLEKSRKAFKEELLRCYQLKIDYLNFHPGAAVGSTEEECLDTIAESLLELEPLANGGQTRLLIEITAGQGTNVGYKFEHLGYIIKKVQKKIPIGVCIDTCHCFAAGYDIRTSEGWTKTLKEFDEIIGLDYLFAFHVNDSLFDLGSRKDRHANLGKGKIGLECFKFIMTDPRTKYLPKYLETPNGDIYWEDEINILKKFGKNDAHKN
jgi:deoxyribonuclease IV